MRHRKDYVWRSGIVVLEDTSQLSINSEEVRICFSVSDTGIGIPLEKQALVFESFKQVDESINRSFGGTGLGLFIAKQIADKLQGDIQLMSEVEQGSTFVLYLPKGTGERLEKRVRVIEPVSAFEENLLEQAENLMSDREMILIIELDGTFAGVLGSHCVNHGFQFIHSMTGKKGLMLARYFQPFAILLELTLPDMNGIEVLTQLKADSLIEHIPVFVMSKDNQTQNHLKQAEQFYQKPVSSQQMKQLFKQLSNDRFTPVNRASGVNNKKNNSERTREHLLVDKHILIVDDDVRNIYAIKGIFTDYACYIHVAKNGFEALNQLSQLEQVDLILMDVMMPEMNGWEATKRIRLIPKHRDTPIIILTAKAMPQDRLMSFEVGASDYLSKPLNIEQLFNMICLWLQE